MNQEKELAEELEKQKIKEVLRREIKSFGTSGYVIIPRKYIGKEAIIFVKE